MEDLLPLLAAALEMRAGIGVDVARLCAERAAASVRGELLEISERLARGRATARSCSRWTSASGSAILDGAGNLAYQLAFNSLIRAVHAQRELSVPWLEQELARSDYRRPIAAAIAAGRCRRAPPRRPARRSPSPSDAPPLASGPSRRRTR